MDTLYFAGFCIFISLIILWGYLKDDHAEFNEGLGKKKFSPKKPDAEPSVKTDEEDTPRANLL